MNEIAEEERRMKKLTGIFQACEGDGEGGQDRNYVRIPIDLLGGRLQTSEG